jgi:hypothetical protein
MLNNVNKYLILIIALCLIAVAGGCQKPGPIDLNPGDDGGWIPPSGGTIFSLLATDDIDSSKLLPPLEVRGLGQLLIEGAEYDSRIEHHTASVARALFYDGSSPMIIAGDTVFPTLNVGTINIDALPLSIVDKHYTNSAGTIDSVLGSQYLLFNKDGHGGKGFSYVSNQTYRWNCSGDGSVSAFDYDITVPQKIHVTSPTERSTIRSSSNLLMTWTGGADTVRIYIRELNDGVPGKIWLQYLVKSNSGRANINKSLLQLLPRDQSEFMLTVASSQISTINLNGFAGDVIVQAVTSHNLIVQIRP